MLVYVHMCGVYVSVLEHDVRMNKPTLVIM